MCIINIGWYDINDYMKNLFKDTKFMLGVTKYKNLPEDVGDEILLAGRSNAGKSSALNALTGNPKLARISKTPGRTTEINFFEVNFARRESLKAVVIFMDIRHPLKDRDKDMIALCNSENIPFIPVLTKSDKLSNNQKNKALSQVNKNMVGIEAIAVSSKDITGFDKLSKGILDFSSA
jgi:GTP-binding protein